MLRLQRRRPDSCAELIGVVLAYSGTHPITRKFVIPPLLASLEKILGADALSAALARGRALNFDDVLTALIDELSAEEPQR